MLNRENKPKETEDYILSEDNIIRTLTGARDMLRESAKQHRIKGDTGHACYCEMHVDSIDIILSLKPSPKPLKS